MSFVIYVWVIIAYFIGDQEMHFLNVEIECGANLSYCVLSSFERHLNPTKHHKNSILPNYCMR